MKDKKPLLWIPVYIDKYLFGSTRIELEPDERSVWMDLLVLAGKDSGYVRANEGVPYFTTQLSGMLVIPEELLKRTIEKCLQYGKIKILKDNTIFIKNWEKYKLSPRHKRRFGAMSAETDTMSPKEDAIDIDIDIDIDKDKVKKSKVKKSKVKKNKRKPRKTKMYSEYVSLTEKEYERFIKEYGEDNTKKFIEKLNNYKGSNGKKYKDDNLAIRNWVVDEVLKIKSETGSGIDVKAWKNAKGGK